MIGYADRPTALHTESTTPDWQRAEEFLSHRGFPGIGHLLTNLTHLSNLTIYAPVVRTSYKKHGDAILAPNDAPHYVMRLNNLLQAIGDMQDLSWETTQTGPQHVAPWTVIAYSMCSVELKFVLSSD